MKNVLPIMALAMFACGKAKPEPKPEPATPTQVVTFDMAADRLARFYDAGFVVTRDAAGTALNQGDALIWTGEAVYALDCARGAAPAAALAQMVTDTGGAIYRHPSLPANVSLDGAIGFYRGVAKRALVCGDAATWAPLIAEHVAYMADHGGLLNAGDVAGLPAGFTYLRDKLAWRLGVGDEPSAAAQAKMETAAAAWAVADIAAKAACYRSHLALNTFQIIEELGGTVSPAARNTFCAATKTANLATSDHWCGRDGLDQWLTAFKWNVYQYAHQRCPGWESPDAKGEEPAVDELVGWADLHGTPK